MRVFGLLLARGEDDEQSHIDLAIELCPIAAPQLPSPTARTVRGALGVRRGGIEIVTPSML